MRNRAESDQSPDLTSRDASRPSGRLHIALSCNHIVVTEASDLHAPQWSISGQRVVDYPEASVFKLLSVPAPGVDPALHKAATGIAVMTWAKRGRRLTASGIVAGAPAGDERILDAIEER